MCLQNTQFSFTAWVKRVEINARALFWLGSTLSKLTGLRWGAIRVTHDVNNLLQMSRMERAIPAQHTGASKRLCLILTRVIFHSWLHLASILHLCTCIGPGIIEAELFYSKENGFPCTLYVIYGLSYSVLLQYLNRQTLSISIRKHVHVHVHVHVFIHVRVTECTCRHRRNRLALLR